MREKSTTAILVWSLIAILAIACVLLAWRPWSAEEPTPPEEPESTEDQVTQQIAEVLQLHEDQRWSEAISAWNDLLKHDGLSARQASEIRRHRRNAREARDAETEGIKEFERPLGETQGVPEKAASEDDFLVYYPQGRKVQSAAFFNVNGMGRNQAWILQGDVYFGYQYQILLETTVKDNPGNYAIFDVNVRDIKQIRAISEEKVELRIPEKMKSRVLSIVWQATDTSLRFASRTYRVVRALAGVALYVDPGLQRTLTTLNKFSKGALTDRKDVEIVEQVENLAGRQFEITYVRDLGVTKIDVVNGEALTRRQLEQLAYNSSVLMDYYVCPDAEEKQKGDRWDVRAEDIAGLISLDMDVQANGTISLEHGGTAVHMDHQCLDLQVVGGEVDAEFDTDLGRQTTTIRPTRGYLRFSPELRMVRVARIGWSMKQIEVSENHLLFGTSHVHDVRVESFYEAKRVDTSGP